MIYRVEKRFSYWVEGAGVGPYFWYDLPANKNAEAAQLLRSKPKAWVVSDRLYDKLKDRPDLIPTNWKHPRMHHFSDPYLREVSLELYRKGELRNFLFGCKNIESLISWFEEDLLKVLMQEGFRIHCYKSKVEYHGLRQSMFDSRTVVQSYPFHSEC